MAEQLTAALIETETQRHNGGQEVSFRVIRSRVELAQPRYSGLGTGPNGSHYSRRQSCHA